MWDRASSDSRSPRAQASSRGPSVGSNHADGAGQGRWSVTNTSPSLETERTDSGTYELQGRVANARSSQSTGRERAAGPVVVVAADPYHLGVAMFRAKLLGPFSITWGIERGAVGSAEREACLRAVAREPWAARVGREAACRDAVPLLGPQRAAAALSKALSMARGGSSGALGEPAHELIRATGGQVPGSIRNATSKSTWTWLMSRS